MKDARRLTIVALISVAGLVLTWAGMHAGASLASPPTPPSTSADPAGDTGVMPGVQAVRAITLSRIQTVTLEPMVRPSMENMSSDLMSDTWPIYVQDVYYNWPGSPYFVKVLAGAWDIQGSTPHSLTLAFSLTANGDYIATPGAEAWVAVSYRRRAITTNVPYAAQAGGVITVVSKAGSSSGQIFYDPFTSTVIYTRYLPAGAPPEDYWGKYHAPINVVARDPQPFQQTQDLVRWVSSTNYFVGQVALSDTIFGSDLTVTQFSVSPLTAQLHSHVYTTVTVQNVGPITAWRWFRTEFYLKPESDLPPTDPTDHSWGQVEFLGSAIYRLPGTEFSWKIDQLGPSQSITLVTVITVERSTGSGRLKAYAQADTAEVEETYQYAWFGSNPEGYCYRSQGCDADTRPPQEYNVVTLRDQSGKTLIIYIPETYLLNVSPISMSRKAPAGRAATFYPQVINDGNVTDTYTVTVASQRPWAASWPATVGPVRYYNPYSKTMNIRAFPVAVTVPFGTQDGIYNWLTVTLQSRGDPTQRKDVRLQAIAGYYQIYMPIVKKNASR